MIDKPGALSAGGVAPKRPLSSWWRHGVILVMVFGFSGLGVVTALTYSNAPPIPRRVVDPTGSVLFTGEDVELGQSVFFKHGLMEHGTLWGHGAYLGPDYTAEHLHRLTQIAREDITASIGVALCQPGDTEWRRLFARAEGALRAAKLKGRGQVALARSAA